VEFPLWGNHFLLDGMNKIILPAPVVDAGTGVNPVYFPNFAFQK
jgi:hypothetical protein